MDCKRKRRRHPRFQLIWGHQSRLILVVGCFRFFGPFGKNWGCPNSEYWFHQRILRDNSDTSIIYVVVLALDLRTVS